MFNFHKPRTYRSTEGCCICKAKSSSSRFTDSRKYERDTMLCFDLKCPRQGEICNACVLLVKRYKRLPVGSKRNWSHIVDAKGSIGPGYNKIQTKYKSERINSRAAAQQQINATVATNSSCNAVNVASSNSSNSLCFVPEKFSKIFKKSKKLKENLLQNNFKRKSSNNNWSQNDTNLIPTTPDSLDSDYEETRAHSSLTGNTCNSSVVQFQTQTRASAYKAQAAAEAKMKIIKLGSKRRKHLQPRKKILSTFNEESFQFFDEEEWRQRKLCCGTLYECPTLGGAFLIDTANFKPCEQHQQQRVICQEKVEHPQENTATNLRKDVKKASNLSLAKSIIHTIPAVVQLQPSQGPLPSSTLTTSAHSMSNNIFNKISTTSSLTTPTPVLKKHHLFFKRQSECFPQGDIVTTTNNNSNIDISTCSAKNNKTESEPQHQNQQLHHSLQQRPKNNLNLQRHIENAIRSSSQTNSSSTVLTESLNSLALSVYITSSSSASIPTMPQMPKHSLAKVTTILPTLTTSIQQNKQTHTIGNSTLSLAKPNGVLHRVKSDSGKIVKHSLEKFNTAIRLKTSDINEIKPIIRAVDKSFIIAKPATQANIVSLNATNNATTTYQSLASYNTVGPTPITTTSLSATSPTSSTSSTSSTKFSDNSSDSGFDENMLDRKSASPLQDDCEKKMLSRTGVQTMFLASGVQIYGQQQNVVLPGNDMAAKIVHTRKYNTMATGPIMTSSRTHPINHNPTTTGVKIAQLSSSSLISPSLAAANYVGPQISMSSAAQAKMRAIYNNNNTIQHENGITTIVPASSLAATTQTAAMQNIAPSTVTITPAPPVGAQFHPQNVMPRKLTSANIINIQSNTNNLSNSHINASGNHHHLSSSINSSSNNHNNVTNQKIILLKTTPNNTTTVTAPESYGSHAGGAGGGGPLGNGGGGR